MKVLVIAAMPASLVGFRFDLLKAMVSKNHEVVACAAQYEPSTNTPEDVVAERLAAAGISYQPVPMQRTGMNPVSDLQTLYALYSLCRRVRPDVVMSYTVKPNIYGSLAARLAGVPRICSLITGAAFGFADGDGHTLIQQVVRLLYRAALSTNAIVIFQNPDDRQAYLDAGVLRRSAVTTIVNGSGVDVDYYAPVPLPSGPPRFAMVARLVRSKGVYEYVEAARRVKAMYPDTQFLLLGRCDTRPGSLKASDVQAWVDEGIVTWPGAVQDVRPYIAQSSVYVLPSYHEGTPRTVLEAMAMGRPVVTTDAPGCRETVIDGENGFLVPVRDPGALAAAMERFITQPQLIASMGERSRQIAEEKYDVHKVNTVMLHAMGLL